MADCVQWCTENGGSPTACHQKYERELFSTS
jgi:hypothetical protein